MLNIEENRAPNILIPHGQQIENHGYIFDRATRLMDVKLTSLKSRKTKYVQPSNKLMA